MCTGCQHLFPKPQTQLLSPVSERFQIKLTQNLLVACIITSNHFQGSFLDFLYLLCLFGGETGVENRGTIFKKWPDVRDINLHHLLLRRSKTFHDVQHVKGPFLGHSFVGTGSTGHSIRGYWFHWSLIRGYWFHWPLIRGYWFHWPLNS